MSEQLSFDFTDVTPDDKAYIKQLEEKLEQATLHPGYIAKAGEPEQQCLKLAEQLMQLQKSFQDLMKLYQSTTARLSQIAVLANEENYR